MMLDYKEIFRCCPANYIVLMPNPPKYTILDVTHFHEELLCKTRKELIGFGLFEVYPENPDNHYGKENLQALRNSLDCAIKTRQENTMDTLRYDVPIPGKNKFDVRFWSIKTIPILSENGDVHYIMNTSIDITGLYKIGFKI